MDVTDSEADDISVGHSVDFFDISKVFHASTSFQQRLPQTCVISASQTKRSHLSEHVSEGNEFGEKMKH